ADFRSQPVPRHRDATASQVRHVIAHARREIVIRAIGEAEPERVARVDGLHPRDRIAPDQVVQKAAMAQKMASLADREIVSNISQKDMAAVIARAAFVEVSVSSSAAWADTWTDSVTLPTSSVTLSGRTSPTRSSTPACTMRLKPVASKVTRYAPGCSERTR